MGIYASLTLIPADTFSAILDIPGADFPIEPRITFDVGKAWNFLETGLEDFGEPLSLAIRGDFPQGGTLEESVDGYFALISPDLVYRVAQAFEKVDSEEFLEKTIKKWGPMEPEYRTYCRERFFELKVAYNVADRSGAAFMMSIG